MPLRHNPALHNNVLSLFSLKGKIAAVTGGATGNGFQIAHGLAEAGADVALIYATSTQAPQVAAKIAEQTGVRVQAYQSDVSKRDTIAATMNQVAEELGRGRLDIVVANAGVATNCPSLEYTEDQFRRDNNVNYEGVMWTAQAAGRIFKKQGQGNLVITTSMSASIVNRPQTQAAYNASKAATLHLAKSLAVEWTEFARVNCVSPGYMMTRMISQAPKERFEMWLSGIPGGRVGDPAELRAAYVFLASDACPYMTGANLTIDGGFTLT